MAKLFDRRGDVVAHDHKYTGEEPKWHDAADLDVFAYHARRIAMLNFYNYYCNPKDLEPDVMKQASILGYDIKMIKSNVSKVTFTCGKLCRALNRGMPSSHADWKVYSDAKNGITLSEANNDIKTVRIELDRIAIMSKREKDSEEAKSGGIITKLSPLDHLNNKVQERVISQLEHMIDDCGWCDAQTAVDKLNLTSILTAENIPVKGLGIVESWLTKYETSLNNALNKSDEFDIEGWAFLSKTGIKYRIKAIDTMIQEVVKFRGANKKTKIPRLRKSKTADAQVKKLNYKDSDADLGITSVSPITIPGSTELYSFNTKYKKLTVFYASSKQGFSVKGSTLLDFDQEKSYTRSLRKPEEVIPIIVSGGKRNIAAILKTLKTKTNTANGRINKETILLHTK
jgi:hypothetical protein